MSSGICLGGMLLFTITGITLNHAGSIKATPSVTNLDSAAPPDVKRAIASQAQIQDGRHPLPAAVSEWVRRQYGAAGDGSGEWSAAEVYVSLPRPGGDAWLTINRASGEVHYERTERGWISYFNDLHKGRHTGESWSVYIDVLAAACLVFTITGLILLQTHAAKRPATWPVVGFSIFAPFLILFFFVHR